MMIWILLTGFFLVALAVILVPVFRYRAEAAQSHNKNIAVYKAQLRELDDDQNNGVLSESEAVSARLEIERRLLKIADHQESRNNPHDKAISLNLLVAVTTIILLLSAGFYLKIGLPHMPDFILKDQPHSVAERAKKNPESPDMIREVAEIKAHLLTNPTNIQAWRALGQYQGTLQNKAEAAQAYQRWHELAPDDIDAAVVYAESLIILSNGRVGPAATLVLHRARTIQPHNPGVRHYLALAQYQSGNIELALANWKSLAADSKPGAPWINSLRRWIRQAENDLGIQSDNMAVGPAALNDSERAAIMAMSSTEQADMIKSMVARLQDKMDKNPKNIEGWIRLAKAYEVLGQQEGMVKSLEQALKYAPVDLKPQIKKQLEVLLKQE